MGWIAKDDTAAEEPDPVAVALPPDIVIEVIMPLMVMVVVIPFMVMVVIMALPMLLIPPELLELLNASWSVTIATRPVAFLQPEPTVVFIPETKLTVEHWENVNCSSTPDHTPLERSDDIPGKAFHPARPP